MADKQEIVGNRQTFSPDNRLSFEQVTLMAARLQDRHGVSSLRALKMVEEIQQKRQDILDERVVAAGGTPWSKLRDLPDADAQYRSPVN